MHVLASVTLMTDGNRAHGIQGLCFGKTLQIPAHRCHRSQHQTYSPHKD